MRLGIAEPAHALLHVGESYAGVYVPTLAKEVLKGNDEGQQPTLNLKGYIIGNGVTDPEFDGNALVPFARGKSLISEELFSSLHRECRSNFYSPSGELHLLDSVHDAASFSPAASVALHMQAYAC